MIYAHRPDATACADYDIWNNRMNRYVRRGSKGIALLDESSGYPRLHYVFDVSDAPCYILKITIYRSDDTMVDKFSQVAGNVPVTNNDPNRRYTVINGYPVVLNFAKEPNPGVFERVRDILLATSYTKKTS